jgi:hypothetical protein
MGYQTDKVRGIVSDLDRKLGTPQTGNLFGKRFSDVSQRPKGQGAHTDKKKLSKNIRGGKYKSTFEGDCEDTNELIQLIVDIQEDLENLRNNIELQQEAIQHTTSDGLSNCGDIRNSQIAKAQCETENKRILEKYPKMVNCFELFNTTGSVDAVAFQKCVNKNKLMKFAGRVGIVKNTLNNIHSKIKPLFQFA